MTLLDRYLARRMAATLLQIMLAMVLLYVIIDLLTTRQNNIAKYDIPWLVVVQYYLATAPVILFQYQTTALAVLIAGLMVLGRAAQDQEITAALAGGVSLRRLVCAPAAVALLVAVGAFLFEDTLGVRAAQNVAHIEREYFSQFQRPENPVVSLAHLRGGWTCHILKFNREALTGQDVYIHAITKDSVNEIRAHRIFWDEGRSQWMLEDGRVFTFDPKKEWEQKVERITQMPAPFNETPEELFCLEKPSKEKSFRQLGADLRHAEERGMPVNAQWVDFHAKFARPALCFVMIWLAIPFAIRLRRGGIMMGFGVSIAIALAYLLVFYVTMGLGQLDKLNPAIAAWFANVLFFAAGLVMFHKTPT